MTGRDLARAVADFPSNGMHSPAAARRLADECRRVLRAHEDAALDGRPAPDAAAARVALMHLGGDGERRATSLRDYDHLRFGPFLGVSDEGSAAAAVLRAARSSPKAVVLGRHASAIELGVGLDAERLGAVGEVPVGPEEYARIWLACAGRLLTTTNVGTRINVRYYQPFPVVRIDGANPRAALAATVESLRQKFEPFLNTLNGRPRPLTVYLEFGRSRMQRRQRVSLLAAIVSTLKRKKAIAPNVHHVGLAIRLFGRIQAKQQAARDAIDLAAAAGLREVAINSTVSAAADKNISQPGLLQYLAPGAVGPMFRYAKQQGVTLRTRNSVDPVTVGRSVWAVLNSARGMGLHLGKYGVFPLTLDESEAVIKLVQKWLGAWSAAPVFFVDQGLLAKDKVYTDGDTAAGLRLWLAMVARHRVPVVLIDTVNKGAKRRLLKTGSRPELGALGPRQIADISAEALRRNVKTLWAGGLTQPEAYLLGKAQVFGIYVTTAAAEQRPVPAEYDDDPMLASVKEPTVEGVLGVKVLVEAGFLHTALQAANPLLAARIDDAAQAYLAAAKASATELARLRKKLFASTVDGWKVHLSAVPR